MNSQMLILFAIFVDHAKKETDPKVIASQNAVAVFSFFLFVIYGIFGTILAVFRNDIIKDGNYVFFVLILILLILLNDNCFLIF